MSTQPKKKSLNDKPEETHIGLGRRGRHAAHRSEEHEIVADHTGAAPNSLEAYQAKNSSAWYNKMFCGAFENKVGDYVDSRPSVLRQLSNGVILEVSRLSFNRQLPVIVGAAEINDPSIPKTVVRANPSLWTRLAGETRIQWAELPNGQYCDANKLTIKPSWKNFLLGSVITETEVEIHLPTGSSVYSPADNIKGSPIDAGLVREAHEFRQLQERNRFLEKVFCGIGANNLRHSEHEAYRHFIAQQQNVEKSQNAKNSKVPNFCGLDRPISSHFAAGRPQGMPHIPYPNQQGIYPPAPHVSYGPEQDVLSRKMCGMQLVTPKPGVFSPSSPNGIYGTQATKEQQIPDYIPGQQQAPPQPGVTDFINSIQGQVNSIHGQVNSFFNPPQYQQPAAPISYAGYQRTATGYAVQQPAVVNYHPRPAYV